MSTAPTAQAAGPRVLGIDPGLSGGWALVDERGVLVGVGHFPTRQVIKNGTNSTQIDGKTLAATLAATNATQALVEAVSSRPRQAGQFQFGVNCGLIHGILYAQKVPFTMVSPASWKALYGIKRKEDETKSAVKTEARRRAMEMFPQSAALFSRVKDDGVAEAALIAFYGFSRVQLAAAK